MAQLGEVSEIVEQYRFFKSNGIERYRHKMKTLLDLTTSNEQNDRVYFWNNLGDKMVTAQGDKKLKFLQTRYIEQNHKKNPALAGVASALVPGLGQIYNGLYQSAAISFVFNSLFLWSTVELHEKDFRAPAIASGVIFSIFYTGNIINSVTSARKINQVNSQEVKNKIHRHLFPELEREK